MSADHARATSLFLACVDLAREERRAFLERACADDREVLAEVESLLAHAEDPEILRTGQFVPRWAPVSIPERIGPYRVLGLLGQGGMGVVYRAEQLAPVRREVALKVVRAGFDSPELLARFESEYVALASLSHPHIARLYEVGVAEDGRPYFAMEYVAGEPITDCCDRRSLPLSERIELFARVCGAVQHAHQNAVIHRDIKPSNLLVAVRDGALVPMVIDFGIARVFNLDPARRRATIVGEILGTPEYMSPEQAAGIEGVDTRTDVYSLGAVLYELLAGSPPFWDPAGQVGLEELRRRIREDEAPHPSARLGEAPLEDRRDIAAKRGTDPHVLLRQMKGDLDWIVLKALSGDRARRYASPADLAADLSRHLAHEPVLAGPGGVAYRTVKFVRKRRAAVAVTAAGVVLGAGLGGLSLLNASRVARETERADREAAVAAQVTDVLAGLFERRTVAPRLEQRSAAEHLGPGIERVRQELADRPSLQARMLRALGEGCAAVGDPAAARPLLEEARATLERELGPDHPTTLDAGDSLAQTLVSLGDFEGAERVHAATFEARRRVLGPEHVDTLRSAGHLGYLYKTTDRFDDAAPLLESAASGLRRALGPDNPEGLIAAGFLVGVRLEQGRHAGLEPVLLELVEKMPKVLGDRNVESLAARYNLGCYYALTGRREPALRWLREAIDRGFQAIGIDTDPSLASLSEEPQFRELAGLERWNVVGNWQASVIEAAIHDSRGRLDEAERIYRGVVAGADRTAQPTNESALLARQGLGVLYTQLGRYSELEEIARSWPPVPGHDAEWYLYQCELHRGDEANALVRIARIRDAQPESTAVFAYTTAAYHAVLRDREASRRWLALTVERRLDFGWWATYDVAFDPYREDPQFRALIAQLGRESGDPARLEIPGKRRTTTMPRPELGKNQNPG